MCVCVKCNFSDIQTIDFHIIGHKNVKGCTQENWCNAQKVSRAFSTKLRLQNCEKFHLVNILIKVNSQKNYVVYHKRGRNKLNIHDMQRRRLNSPSYLI